MMEQAEHERLEGFLKWAAAELGISDSSNSSQSLEEPNSCLGISLTVSHFPDAGGRGLGAARDLKKGELVLRVPKSALLTKDSFLKDGLLLSAINNHSALSPTQTLTVCLLYEMSKGQSSFWYPYLMHLPRSYEILATFSEFEKQALQVDDAIWTAEKAISKAELDRKEAYSLMQELRLKPQFLTLRAWIWACATISSRTMHIPWDEAGCLCPVGDFFNYAAPGEESSSPENDESWKPASCLEDASLSSERSTSNFCSETFDVQLKSLTDGGFDEDKAAYCFYARQNYKKGAQVLLSYGTYTNLELLEHYGFLLNENPNDKVFIPLELSMQSSNTWPKESMYIHQDGKPSFSLLCALRLWATPSNRRRSMGHLAYSGSQLSVENEVSILKWISRKCHAVLKKLPTTVEEDSLLLSAIDKIQNCHSPLELGKMLHGFEGQASAFVEAHNLLNIKIGTESTMLCGKAKRSMERWKLAVKWRLSYKKTLIDCISYCTEVIDSLSMENVSTAGTK
ncbi:protein SET DOMAIN GROUP 40 [Ricinus communis]|uniref:Protein SET DOMAIN GROUP, putative n=1 Tax=Ricinus communis TaxID=3988 RepID=B9T3H1_RICCO|nr:protein SET DOMAIN GROUP 40 [Ricinus communis]EEF29592.1 Protein SET DOMAIN GROUP, putative [Ricinus communis]|eukprot:XP_002532790.1 protein SET DOMAIN GROUP 40 [Ricinus communis]